MAISPEKIADLVLEVIRLRKEVAILKGEHGVDDGNEEEESHEG